MINSLDEAIKHAEEVAERLEGKNGYAYTDVTCEECAKEHRQLAEWLRELMYYKDRQDLINKSWQELIRYREGIEKIELRSQAYRECGESILAIGMEQALDILKEVNADERKTGRSYQKGFWDGVEHYSKMVDGVLHQVNRFNKEADEAGMDFTAHVESIRPLNKAESDKESDLE